MKLLNHCKHGERLTDYKRRDRFNTIHLSQMFKTTDPELQLFNLQTTRKLLGKWMRSEIMKSKQIEGHSKIVYLNSLKCSAIRCANPNLAVRLQMSLWLPYLLSATPLLYLESIVSFMHNHISETIKFSTINFSISVPIAFLKFLFSQPHRHIEERFINAHPLTSVYFYIVRNSNLPFIVL